MPAVAASSQSASVGTTYVRRRWCVSKTETKQPSPEAATNHHVRQLNVQLLLFTSIKPRTECTQELYGQHAEDRVV